MQFLMRRGDFFCIFIPKKRIFQTLGCTAYLKYAIFCAFTHCTEVPTREVTGSVDVSINT